MVDVVVSSSPRRRYAQRTKGNVRGTGNQVADNPVPLPLFPGSERAVGHQVQMEVEVQVFGHFLQQVDGKSETAKLLRQRSKRIKQA